MKNKGSEFEKIIEGLERALAGKDVRITRNEHFPDRDTGDLREVDVAIRHRVGSAEILIIVECRDRSRKADVTWIEQIESKGKSVGASKMIAVSKSGFTKGAIRKAQAASIDIRTFTELAEQDVEAWFEAKSVRPFHVVYQQVDVSMKLANEFGVSPEEIDSVAWYDREGSPQPIFELTGSSNRLNALELFQWLYAQQHRKTPEDGATADPQLRIAEGTFQPDELYFCGSFWRVAIKNLRMEFTVTSEELPLKSMERYASTTEPFAHVLHWEFDTALNGEPAHYDVHATVKEKP